MNASEFGTAYNITATAGVTSQPGRLLGFYVNSTSSGTIVFRDGGASGRTLSGTITPAVGFHRFPAAVAEGVHATIAGVCSKRRSAASGAAAGAIVPTKT